MIGICKFFVDDELVHEQRNLITTLGAQRILRHFSGVQTGIAQSIAVGIGDTAAAVGDTELEFEVDQVDVLLISPDFTQETVVFKSRLPKELIATIEEAGLWSVSAEGRIDLGRVIALFNELEDWDDGTFDATNSKIGGNALRLNASTSTTTDAVLLGLQFDFASMAANQNFKLAMHVVDTNTANVKVMFRTDASNYYTLTVTTPAVGYGIFDLPKSGAVATGSPDWANITELAVSTTAEGGGATAVHLDALRSERFDLADPDAVLVTRMVLTAPQEKVDGQAMDIEYSLSIEVT